VAELVIAMLWRGLQRMRSGSQIYVDEPETIPTVAIDTTMTMDKDIKIEEE
jgi:hypothetical protein